MDVYLSASIEDTNWVRSKKISVKKNETICILEAIHIKDRSTFSIK